MSRRFSLRARWLPLAVALLLAGCAPMLVRTPLSDVHKKAITSSKTIGNVAQDEIGVTIQQSQAGEIIVGGLGGSIVGGLVGVVVDAAVTAYRLDSAQSNVGSLRDALFDHDPRKAVRASLSAGLSNVGVLQGTRLEITREHNLDKVTVSGMVDAAGTDAVLLMDFDYRFSSDFKFVVVTSVASILPTKAASSSELKGLATTTTPTMIPAQVTAATPSSSSTAGPAPAPAASSLDGALYRGVFVSTMPVPAGEGSPFDLWAADRGAAAREAIDGGIAEVVRLLAWDLEQGGPKGSSYPVAGGEAMTFQELGLRRWFFVSASGGRLWFRSDAGELASLGDRYLHDARAVGSVPATAHAMKVRLQGGVAGAQVVYVPGREGTYLQEKAEAMKRAFGADHKDESAEIVLADRLRGGRTPIAPNVEAYSVKVLLEALGAMGVATSADRPMVRAEIQDAKLDRTGQILSLRVRFTLEGVGGKVLYESSKTTNAGPEDGAVSEAQKLELALHRSVDALALEPAFAAAVNDGRAAYVAEGGAVSAAPTATVVAKAELPSPQAAPADRPATAARKIRLAGRLASVETFYAVTHEGDASADKSAAMQRAFGGEYKDENAKNTVPPDRLRAGRRPISPSVEAFSAKVLSESLAAMGASTVAGHPILRGEIQEAKLEVVGHEVTVRVRYDVKDAAGAVLYTVVKTAAANPDDGATSEADAFRMALVKSLEALAAEPAFTAAIK